MIWTRRQIVASAAALGSGVSIQARSKTNVLFVVADDLNVALGCYGNPIVRTPNIDRLASRGVVFDRAYCQFPLCAPSRASFLSGRRPETTRVLSLDTPTRRYMHDVIMLPEFFRRNGWFTGQTGKIYHTGPEHEDPGSWDYALEESGKNPPASEVVAQHEMPKPRNHSMKWMMLRTPDEQTPDGTVARKASELIRKCSSEQRPFFLGVGFRRPHSPYAAPKRYFDLYDPARIPLPKTGDTRPLPAAAWYELANQPALSDKETRQYIAAYYACTSFIDAQLGQIFRTFDELSLWDSTAVVFVGDNGYHIGEHGMWHKMTLFEESVRVPLIISTPGGRGAGRNCRSLVELIDIYPTLVSYCGLRPPVGLEGISLAPLLDDPSRFIKAAAYSMVGRSDDRNQSHHQPSYFGKTVRTERWRYTEWDGGRRGSELYDERNDRGEMQNIAAHPANRNTVNELKALLSNHGS